METVPIYLCVVYRVSTASVSRAAGTGGPRRTPRRGSLPGFGSRNQGAGSGEHPG